MDRGREGFDTLKCPGVLLNAQHAGNVVGWQGGDNAGDQRVILEQADVADLHGNDCGSQRRSEKSRERGAHAGHDHDPPCAFAEMESFAHFVAKASADLQRSSFTANGSAQEVGKDRRAEDERRHCARDTLFSCDREKNGVCTLAAVEFLVEEYDHSGANGHQEDDLGMCFPQRSGAVDPQRKDAGHQADKRAAQKSVDQKLDHLDESCLYFKQDRFQLIFEVVIIKIHNSPPCAGGSAPLREAGNFSINNSSILEKKPQEKLPIVVQ